ncbi:hypothetical protein [Streptomyces galbus]|uniref:hypothetical protein n=1 Tax=Streptomyces galbus TaxID=33898 RepID=UPI001B32F970|nr:hypothetical protein [Streptomyces galbus]
MTVQQSSTSLPGPVRTAASALGKVPGAGLVGRMAGGAWHRAGALSPHGRRMAVYAGAGVLGVTGVVEWPVAVTGAAVAWLTRPRPEDRRDAGPQGTGAARGVARSAAHTAAKATTAGRAARAGQRRGSTTGTTRAPGSGAATGTGETEGTGEDTDIGPAAGAATDAGGTGDRTAPQDTPGTGSRDGTAAHADGPGPGDGGK